MAEDRVGEKIAQEVETLRRISAKHSFDYPKDETIILYAPQGYLYEELSVTGKCPKNLSFWGEYETAHYPMYKFQFSKKDVEQDNITGGIFYVNKGSAYVAAWISPGKDGVWTPL